MNINSRKRRFISAAESERIQILEFFFGKFEEFWRQ